MTYREYFDWYMKEKCIITFLDTDNSYLIKDIRLSKKKDGQIFELLVSPYKINSIDRSNKDGRMTLNLVVQGLKKNEILIKKN